MPAPDHQAHEDENLEAPPRLVSALQALRRLPDFVPPTVDQAVLRAARRQFRPRLAPRRLWLRFVPWAAGGVAALLLLTLLPRLLQHPRSSPDGSLAREDLNRDGRVDVLDAFALARQLKTGRAPSLQLDVNGDGVVDERDVQAIAAQAVKLEKGGRS